MDISTLRLPHERTRTAARYALAAIYFAAGGLHLYAPDGFIAILPPWVPFPRDTILFTGLCEIAGAAGLLSRRCRRLAGIMLAIYAVCVFPANIYQALGHIPLAGRPVGWWYNGPRLALQPFIIWWPLFCTKAAPCKPPAAP